MAGIGGRSRNQRGPHRKRNRYNPSAPDWNAVHNPSYMNKVLNIVQRSTEAPIIKPEIKSDEE